MGVDIMVYFQYSVSWTRDSMKRSLEDKQKANLEDW